ncbi:hypothetical protein MANES_01G248300v8 [Manihot esculenta]|uniref:Uncharacterized protein n=1 Tax=Manihot esculenta TaxID=3983 RepID=A0A2C9WR85_MANES|nr:hypothetical protein MANES_01G248300v8 [Manihot esculenta]
MKKTLGFQEALLIWDLDSLLYDSYELVSLSHHIERHLMILPSLGVSRRPSNTVTGSALLLGSGERERTRGRSSMVKNWSEFVKSKLWRRKRRRNGIGHSFKDKPKKVKAGVLPCGFRNSFHL